MSEPPKWLKDAYSASCMRCNIADKKPSIAARLNNQGLPNSDSDKWGMICADCVTPHEQGEMDGSNYFGKGWRNDPTR